MHKIYVTDIEQKMIVVNPTPIAPDNFHKSIDDSADGDLLSIPYFYLEIVVFQALFNLKQK